MLHISTAFSSKVFTAFGIGVRGGQIIPSEWWEAQLKEKCPPSVQAKTTAMGCWQDLETPLLESLKIRPPRVASLRPANNTQHVLGDSWGHFHSSDGDIYNQYRPPKWFAQLVSPNLTKSLEYEEKRKFVSFVFFSLHYLYLHIDSLVEKKYFIYLSLLKPLRWHSRGCLLLKMLHLPPCSHCLY